MRFWLNLLISLSLIPYSAFAKPSNYDYAYRGAAYYYYTSPTIGDFLRRIPLRDQPAHETLEKLARKSGASRVQTQRLEWDAKARTIQVTIAGKTATVGFVDNNTGYFTLNGKRVKIESGAEIEKTWNEAAAILKPGAKSAFSISIFPEANAQGIGILEGILLAAALTAVVIGAAAYANQEFVQPAFCTSSVDPRNCLRAIAETVKALTEDARPKITITAFECKDKNLAHAAFFREPNVNLDYSGTYNPDTVKYFTPPALFPMPVEIPVSGGPKSMTFKTFYSETPDMQSKCTFELDKDFKITNIVSGQGTKVCDQVGTGNADSLLKVQAGVQFPIDVLMECCRSKACESQVSQYVNPNATTQGPAKTTTGSGNAVE